LEANFVENVLRLTPWQTGVRFLPLTFSILAFGAAVGMVMNRVPIRVLLACSGVLLGAGMLLVDLANQQLPWTALLPSMIVTGTGMGLFNPPRASAAILVADPARSGMASGASETFQQIGTALGIAAIGSLFQNQVARDLSGSAVGRQLGAAGVHAHSLGATVASGGARQAAAVIPAPLRSAFLDSADSAFVRSMHFSFVLLAVVCALCALTALLFVRQRDLRAEVLEADDTAASGSDARSEFALPHGQSTR
jgi:fucose permease